LLLTNVMLGLPGFVGATVSAATVNLNVVETVTRASAARTVTFGALAAVGVPVILPVDALIASPAGKPVAL
jgi:HD-like signal output (HDOD) protein